MTTIDKIRAEIERRKKEMQDKGEQKDLHDSEIIRRCIISTCNDLLSFLDTLEEPVSDDLEEAEEEYVRRARETPGHEWMTRDIVDAFIARAEWMKKKMMDDAYEEEVQEVYRDEDGIHCSVSVGTDYKPGTIVYVITIPKEKEQ